MSNYGLFEKIRNVYWFFKSKLISKKARLIRFPIIIRGKKNIEFGNNITTGSYCRIEAHGKSNTKMIVFGNNVNIGYNVRISACSRIEIGNNVLIGSNVLIIDNSHGKYSGSNQDNPIIPPNTRKLDIKPVTVCDNVWIGENSVIQKGVIIGKGSVIGANSVVTKNIPEKTVAVGSPAIPIRRFDEEERVWKKIK